MRRVKQIRRIVVGGVEYRWVAVGDCGYIRLMIRPASRVGPAIGGVFGYHESHVPSGDGSHGSLGNQIVITGRIVRRVIEHAVERHGYKPDVEGEDLRLGMLDDVIPWDDAVRAVRKAKESP